MRIHKYLWVAVYMGMVCMLAGCGETSVEYGTFIPEVQDSSLYGRFDGAGNYITQRGILLTADQYEELNQCYDRESIDTSNRAYIQQMLWQAAAMDTPGEE